MCGAYYVTIALLIATSNQIAAEFNQSESVQPTNNDVVASGGTIDNMSPRRDSREPQDDLTLDEERTHLPSRSTLERVEPTIDKMIYEMNNKEKDVIANAADAIKNHEKLMLFLKSKSSKRHRIDATPESVGGQSVGGQELPALPNSGKSPVLLAKNLPSVSAKRLDRGEPMNNAVRFTTQHDFRPAPSGSSTTSAAALNNWLHKQVIPQKKFEFDLNTHPNEVEIRNNKHQRIDPTPSNANGLVLMADDVPSVLANRLGRDQATAIMRNAEKIMTEHDLRLAPPGQYTSRDASSKVRLSKQLIAQTALDFDRIKHPDIRNSGRQRNHPTPYDVNGLVLYALPNPEKAAVWVATNVPIVLKRRLNAGMPTVIMYNAEEFITGHDFRPASVSEITSSDTRIDSQLIAEKALEFGIEEHPDEVKFITEHYLRLRGEKARLAHSATRYDRSVVKDWEDDIAKGPEMRKDDQATIEIIPFHAAFLQAISLPFHQYPQETAKMMKMIGWESGASPSNHRISRTFVSLAERQEYPALKRLLGSDLEKLLGKGLSESESNEMTLREAYAVKLFIMYELFYDFCYTRPTLFKDLPKKVDRIDWILMFNTLKRGSSNNPILLPHD